jgi:hypothetical protein
MSKLVTQISTELYDFLNGNNLDEKQHEAMMLLTVSEDLWPHTAMISVGEIVLTQSELRIALWPNTHTTNNILRTNKASLVVIYAGKVHYIQLSLKKLPDIEQPKYDRIRFVGTIASAREDSAKYADIISGVTFNLKNPSDVLSRWQDMVEELKK